MWHNNKWLSLSLLAIILPTSLLVTFKLAGIIPEPQQLETITLETVNWTMERPSDSDVNIGERVDNAYADGEAAVGIGVHVAWYIDNPTPSMPPLNGRDAVLFVMYANFSVFCGSGISVVVKCRPIDDNATVYIWSDFLAVNNVSDTRIRWFGDNESEAYVATKIVRSPCYLRAQVYWVFSDQNSMEHQLDVTLETTYFNGATYKRLVLPIRLQMSIPTNTRGK